MRKEVERRRALIKSNNPHLAGGDKQILVDQTHGRLTSLEVVYSVIFCPCWDGCLVPKPTEEPVRRRETWTFANLFMGGASIGVVGSVSLKPIQIAGLLKLSLCKNI